MNAQLRPFGKASATDWQSMIKILKEAKAERDKYLPIMTEFERTSVSSSIGETKEQYRPTIEAGVLTVWNDAKSSLKAALYNMDLMKRKITNSWDASKLAAEMQVYSLQIEAAAKNGDPVVLKKIYQDAQESGDRYKQRAAAEALQGLVEKVPAGKMDIHGTDVKMIANRLELQARRDLEALNTSPELNQAHELTAVKVQELNAAKSLLFDTAEVLGDGRDFLRNERFIKALESVQQDDAGNYHFEE